MYFINRRILRQGDTGADVELLQRILRGAGYDPGPTDGIFGPRTTQAVITFQRDNNLVPDGIVGPRTYAALDLIYP